MLTAETDRLEAEQRSLLRELSQETAPTAEVSPELADLGHTLIHYRSLHHQIAHEVLRLIAPYLESAVIQPAPKEGLRWPSFRSEER